MLKELNIANLALIENLHLTCGPGLIVLTGETGAGKSIILQAIQMLAGDRASVAWIRAGAEEATVEALFECQEHGVLAEKIREMGFATDGDVVIKRILSSHGKSRYYINGSLATARAAGELTENLLCIASQHDHQQLLAPASHLDFLDTVGNLWDLRRQYGDQYDSWLALKNELQRLRQKENDKEQRRDFLVFQCQEIEDVAILPGEDEELVMEKDRLKSVDELMRLGGASYEVMNESVVPVLGEIRKNIAQMAVLDRSLAGLAEEVAGQSYQLAENCQQLLEYLDRISNDPARLETVTARIHLLQQLKRKYGGSLDAVLEYAAQAKKELAGLEELDQRCETLAKELTQAQEQLISLARRLSEARHKAAGELSARIAQELLSLNFDHADFEIGFNGPLEPKLEDLTRTGWDSAEFIFSANPGEPVKPLAKIASGGELSRVMLALKSILARQDQVETVIFDEIDAGISGKAAESVARKIKELAGHHQVVCITHLPQIAACAGEHFKVEKKVAAGRTNTAVARLTQEDRIDELARMLDGESFTDKTLAYARELITRNS